MPAGKINARILVCNGADDTFVPTAEYLAFEEEMRKASADYQINLYGGAVHSFTNPDADRFGIKGVGYHADADRRSWMAMKNWLSDALKNQVPPKKS